MTSDVAKKEQLAQARATASQIRQGIHNYLHTLALIRKAFEQDHWRVLGYATWSEYVDTEFGEDRLKLPAEWRLKAVTELRLSGMSQRAIGDTIGVSHTEVGRQLRSGGTNVPPDTKTRGTDGKTYAASRPDHPASRGEEADGQPASPGPATGPREADGDDAPEAAGSSPDGDGLADGQPAGDSHSSSEAEGESLDSPSSAAGDSVEDSGETSTDGAEELRVPALQPDSSDAAGAPAHFPAAGAPDPDWKTAFLADVFALCRLTRHDVDVVADQADSECIAEMGRAFAEIAEYRTKVLAALKASLPTQ